MIAFKCKMCGGELNITEGSNICECEFCGTQQTIPSADNDKKVNLFNRANRLRMNAEFDKAATVYASITAEFPEEAEAYWGLCLCKYGIEYVDDPLTGNKIPTCHRTLPESIMDDSDFDQACENADSESKKLYREEAKAIDRLQQDILNIVASEEPFDVFICYKETDEDGERTDDSVISQEIYDFLTEKGLKVFFARITLEDKLGQQYEPYIYAALHSAKVMLAVGTQFDYFDAVWVKNEWARYLDMMKTDKSKTLIPCYKGIDAYDMPREFKNLQALDMGKIGWKQDLLRGIKKLTATEEKVQQQAISQYMMTGSNVENLMKRARLFMEDGEFDNAREYLDKVLDENAEYAPAYVAKVCITQGFHREEELREAKEVFTDSPDWKKAIRFATPEQKMVYQSYAASVLFRIANDNFPKYEKVEQCNAAKNLLSPYAEYGDVSDLIKKLDQKIEMITLYEQRIQRAMQTIDDLQEEFNAKTINKDNKLKEIKDSYQGRIREQKKLIETCEANMRSLTAEEITVSKGLFSGKKQGEIYKKRVEENKRLELLNQELSRLENECNQSIRIIEAERPDPKEIKYSIAKAYYENDLFEEAAIAFYAVFDYRDVKKFVNTDSEIIKATDQLIKKLLQKSSGQTKEALRRVVEKEIVKEENGYCCKDVDEYLKEIIIKSLALLNDRERIEIIMEIRNKDFDIQENGYSKSEVHNLLNDLLSGCYASDPKAIEQQFIFEMKKMDTMIDIWNLWERYELGKKYPVTDKYVHKFKEKERLYGKSRNIESEKNQIEKLLLS